MPLYSPSRLAVARSYGSVMRGGGGGGRLGGDLENEFNGTIGRSRPMAHQSYSLAVSGLARET